MASSNLMVGLEIGTSKICVVVGEGKPDGTVKILGVGQAPSRGVRKGEIVDFETAMKCVHEAVVDAEEKSDIMIRSVYIGITGAHIQSFNNRGCVTLPEDRDEIDEQDVEDRRNITEEDPFPHNPGPPIPRTAEPCPRSESRPPGKVSALRREFR